MRLLFSLDQHDYKEGGTVFSRPSVRGILIADGLLAMVYSKKYDYCKFPGGGIEPAETHAQALMREVREETGLCILRESIVPFGFVHRVQKGWHEDIFVQDNYYYFCKQDGSAVPQSLDDYEAEEQFTLRYLTLREILQINRYRRHGTKDADAQFPVMLERENRVLELLGAQYPELCSDHERTVK